MSLKLNNSVLIIIENLVDRFYVICILIVKILNSSLLNR